MPAQASVKKPSRKNSSKKEKPGFNLEISTDAQVAFSKGIILALVVVAMVILAYYRIFEPVVWSSLMTIAGYVAFVGSKSSTNRRNQ